MALSVGGPSETYTPPTEDPDGVYDPEAPQTIKASDIEKINPDKISGFLSEIKPEVLGKIIEKMPKAGGGDGEMALDAEGVAFILNQLSAMPEYKDKVQQLFDK